MDSPLSPYHALDLTDEKGQMCGKLLADLGVDVIKIEPPSGDPARYIGPFYHDVPHPERSLFWFAFNTNKRSLTLDIRTAQGRDSFLKLVRTADFVLESFPPGYLDSLGLGYKAVSQINPGIILTSITPFGQSGPYRDFKACDLVSLATGGLMYIAGDEDRPPVRITPPQAPVHAGAHAAVGSLIALYHRHRTGLGQHVDVSIQEAIVRTLLVEPVAWAYDKVLTVRKGQFRQRGHILRRDVWDCKDGQIGFTLLTGRYSRGIASLVQWMEEEGKAGTLKDVDWETVDLYSLVNVEEMERQFAAFFSEHTRHELHQEALKRRILLLPSLTPREILEDRQLQARKFWVKVEHPELGVSLTYPGAPFILGEAPWQLHRRAPLIGEHNREIRKEMEHLEPVAVANPGLLDGDKEGGGALAGLKVVDFTWQLAGPFTTKYLADFGAQVIKVETEKAPDILRMSAPYKDNIPGLNRAYIFAGANSSKYSLAIDVRTPTGLAIAQRLVQWADVLAENFSPGVMKRWGLDYDGVKRINSSIIYISLSGLGQSGPRSGHPAFGWHLVGLGGFLHLTGWPDRGGVAPNPAYTDFTTPPLGALAILAAMDYKQRAGKGQYIDMSQFEGALSYIPTTLLDFVANGREQCRNGNYSLRACPHNAYPCRGQDRWCAITVHSNEEWQAFCRARGKPMWSQDPHFQTLEGRKDNEVELDSLVAEWTIALTAEEIVAALQAAGIAAGVVESCQDLLDKDPQIAHRRYFEILEHPEMGPSLHYGWPTKLSRTPYQLKPAPCLGEHSYHVLHDLLQISDEEFANLMAESPESFQ